MHKTPRKDGFMATIAVVLLALSTLAFSLTTTLAAAEYADAVDRREARIQAQLNAHSCADTVSSMKDKYPFLTGDIHLREFGCVLHVDP